MKELKNYIGCKLIQAMPMTNKEFCELKQRPHPQESDFLEGYYVKYPDGYESWTPKEIFEKFYFQIENENKLTKKDIDNFIIDYVDEELSDKTSIVRAK